MKNHLISSLETAQKIIKCIQLKSVWKGTAARSIMENSMSALAKGFREQVIANLNAGMSLQEAAASFMMMMSILMHGMSGEKSIRRVS